MEDLLNGLFWLGIGAGEKVMKKRQEIIIFPNIGGIVRPLLVLYTSQERSFYIHLLRSLITSVTRQAMYI
jgi:hypothetical protein